MGSCAHCVHVTELSYALLIDLFSFHLKLRKGFAEGPFSCVLVVVIYCSSISQELIIFLLVCFGKCQSPSCFSHFVRQTYKRWMVTEIGRAFILGLFHSRIYNESILLVVKVGLFSFLLFLITTLRFYGDCSSWNHFVSGL